GHDFHAALTQLYRRASAVVTACCLCDGLPPLSRPGPGLRPLPADQRWPVSNEQEKPRRVRGFFTCDSAQPACPARPGLLTTPAGRPDPGARLAHSPSQEAGSKARPGLLTTPAGRPDPRARPAHNPSQAAGSRGSPSTRTSKCKCGPVELPVLPTSAMRWPRCTWSPSFTKIWDKWA